jgi:hypothetical protein
VTDSEILRIWNTLAANTKHPYTEARVFSCVVAAYENNGVDFDTGRAGDVMRIVWPPHTALGAVPSEIRGNTADPGNNRNRQSDFARIMRFVRGET